MKDEHGNEMTEEQIMQGALEHLSEACALLYELEMPEWKILASITDRVLTCVNAAMKDLDPRDTMEE